MDLVVRAGLESTHETHDASDAPHLHGVGGIEIAEMTRTRPQASYDSGGDHRRENIDEYGDEAFESEDLSPSRRSVGDELGNLENARNDPSRDAALVASETHSEVEMQVSATSSEGGESVLPPSHPSQRSYGNEVEAEREKNNVSSMPQDKNVPQDTGERYGAGEGEAKVRAGSQVEVRSDDNTAPPPKRQEEGVEAGANEQPLRQPSDYEGKEEFFPLRDDRSHNVGSLDKEFETSFAADADRDSPQDRSLPYRQGRATRRRSSGGRDDDHDVLTPQQFVSQEEELDVGNGAQYHQLLPQQPHGDRCRTRGRQKERIARGTGLGPCTPRARSQENDGPTGRQGRSSHLVSTEVASNIRRNRQQKLIQQLTADNGVLKRKVAGYQLALQLSADEDECPISPSFSAALKLQQASPPSFPREGGTPAPSPRVARGWTHQNPPSPGRVCGIERNLSYTTLVRQLDTGGRQVRILKRANEALGARVNELESGAVLRVAQSRLAEREEEIVALREELSVMNRLARAQDRKFEGSQGYALARRLWLAEEELRLARSTISALGAEVYGLRQFRKAHGRVRRRRSTTGAVEPSARLPSNTGPLQPSPRQPARRRGPSHPEKAADSPRTKRQEEQGETGSGSSAGRRSRSPTTVAFGRSAEASGPLSGGGRSARSTEDETAAECEGQVARSQRMEVKAEMLQRALANMRKKAKGELSAARAEIDELKEDKSVLGKALEEKAKEIRVQLAQVNRLKRELRDLSMGAIKLEEASCVVRSASLPFRTRGVTSAAAAAASATGATKFGVAVAERRVKSAAVTSNKAAPVAAGAGRDSLSSLAVPQRALPPRANRHQEGEREQRGSFAGQSSPMEWNRDWGGDGVETPPVPAVAQPDLALTTGGVERALSELQADRAMASAGSAGEGRGGNLRQAEPDETEVTEVAPSEERKGLRPCPLTGILDMTEPPLRNHRRSYYSEEDGKVYRIPSANDASISTVLAEPAREEERFKCVVDFKGQVRHGEDCALRGVVHKALPPSKRNSLSLKQSAGQEPSDIPALSIGIPVRTWIKDGASDWDPAGVGSTERLSMVESRDRSPRVSCVSEDGKFTPTLNFVRRPTNFSVESVPELA